MEQTEQIDPQNKEAQLSRVGFSLLLALVLIISWLGFSVISRSKAINQQYHKVGQTSIIQHPLE